MYIKENKNINNTDKHLRCLDCGKLLAKFTPSGIFEIKCLRCGSVKSIPEYSNAQVIVIGTDGLILYVNKEIEDITGYSLKESIGENPSRLWGGQMKKDFYQKMWTMIKDKKKPFYADIVNKRKNGELYNAHMVIYPITDKKGKILFYLGLEELNEGV